MLSRFSYEKRLALVARAPRRDDENSDNGCTCQHPILAVEPKKAKFLNEEVHRARTFLVQTTRFVGENILFFYTGNLCPAMLRCGLQASAASGVKASDQRWDSEARSITNPLRKSSSARWPASWAARCERKPASRSLIPNGFRLRRISQDHPPGSFSDQDTTT